MGFNSPDRKEAIKIAESKGYHQSSDGSKMINDKGGSFKFSDTGLSGGPNGTSYNNLADLKKSRGW